MKKLNKILLVDDDPTNNFLNEKILNDLNIAQEIKVLTNGKLAFDYVLDSCNSPEKNCPALIILDHHMPVMDGLELMHYLHTDGILKKMETVFILLAVHTTPQDQEVFKQFGVQEFTSKPLSKQTVMEAYTKYWAHNTIEGHIID